MEPETIEFRAICQDCIWKGNKLANRIPVEAEAKLHFVSLGHIVEIMETKIESIKSYPQMTEYEAKLIFIRKSATEAYESGEIKEATGTILKSIVEISTASSMSKEEVGSLIGNLEKARAFLASFTQGLQIGLATELEPKIKARREKERQEKLISKTLGKQDKRVNELIEMARNLSSLPQNPETKKNIVTKQVCPTCSKEVFSLKFHKC